MIKYDPEQNKISGFMNNAGLQFLYFETIRAMAYLDKPMKVLEIGVWKGRSSHAILSAMLEGTQPINSKYFAIDNWSKDSNEDIKEVMHDFFHLCKNFGHSIGIEIYDRSSIEVIPLFPDDYFDLVFLDGDHSYETLIQELKMIYPKVHKFGFILGHDYRILVQDRVVKAVNEFFGSGNFSVDSKSTIFKHVKGKHSCHWLESEKGRKVEKS
jgi:hypothetical protein